MFIKLNRIERVGAKANPIIINTEHIVTIRDWNEYRVILMDCNSPNIDSSTQIKVLETLEELLSLIQK